MPGYAIHLAVGKQILNNINISNENAFLLGCLAPDIMTTSISQKQKSHFSNDIDHISDKPNIELFMKKYGNRMEEPFIQGVYAHLMVDKWFYSDYLPKLTDRIKIKFSKEKMFSKDGIYRDYNILNKQLIDTYNLNANLVNIETNMDELETDTGQAGIDKVKMKFEKACAEGKTQFIDFDSLKEFIEESAIKIVTELEKMKRGTGFWHAKWTT